MAGGLPRHGKNDRRADMPSGTTSDERSVEHFRSHGWMRVPRAFGPDAARLMRDAVWRALAEAGILRDQRSSWSVERPAYLQQLRKNPVFQAVGSAALRTAIADVLEGRPCEEPRDWGSLFIAFPSSDEFGVPANGWHIDANYTSALWPTGGVKTFALLGDVVPRGGGTQIVSGSHRLVHQWFQDRPPPPGARSAEMRQLLQAHPYIRALHSPGEPAARITRFMDGAEEVDGIALQVIEIAGAAGDVFLVHPLVLHVAAPNNAEEPRFLLSGGMTTDMWGWG
jgi:hypothetical protein